jgi:hypothetical protein
VRWIAQLLEDEHVEYALIGGYALVFVFALFPLARSHPTTAHEDLHLARPLLTQPSDEADFATLGRARADQAVDSHGSGPAEAHEDVRSVRVDSTSLDAENASAGFDPASPDEVPSPAQLDPTEPGEENPSATVGRARPGEEIPSA